MAASGQEVGGGQHAIRCQCSACAGRDLRRAGSAAGRRGAGSWRGAVGPGHPPSAATIPGNRRHADGAACPVYGGRHCDGVTWNGNPRRQRHPDVTGWGTWADPQGECDDLQSRSSGRRNRTGCWLSDSSSASGPPHRPLGSNQPESARDTYRCVDGCQHRGASGAAPSGTEIGVGLDRFRRWVCLQHRHCRRDGGRSAVGPRTGACLRRRGLAFQRGYDPAVGPGDRHPRTCHAHLQHGPPGLLGNRGLGSRMGVGMAGPAAYVSSIRAGNRTAIQTVGDHGLCWTDRSSPSGSRSAAGMAGRRESAVGSGYLRHCRRACCHRLRRTDGGGGADQQQCRDTGGHHCTCGQLIAEVRYRRSKGRVALLRTIVDWNQPDCRNVRCGRRA